MELLKNTEPKTDVKITENELKTESNIDITTATITDQSFKYYNLNDIQDIITLLEKNNDKKYYSLKKYDINRILKILKKENEEKTIMEKKLEKSKKIGKAFSDRYNLFNVLWTNLQKFFTNGSFPFPNGGLCGSFLRQFFELPFALEDEFSEIGYGNPIGHDLDIVIYNNLDDSYKEDLYEYFCKIMKKYQEHVNFSLINPELIRPIEISNKILVQVSDVTICKKDIKENDPLGKINLLNIPHYVFKFKDKLDNSIIEIDVIATKPKSFAGWTNIDFNVNSIILNDYGFHCDYNTNFTEIINCIRKKEARCCVNFLELSLKAEEQGLLRKEKVPYLMQIAWAIRNRFKVLNSGYKNITGDNLIDYSINTTEDCHITSCKAPYFEITLRCKHKLSLMAFIGILEESNYDSSQAIKCPLCRDDLKVNCVTKETSQIESYELISLNDILHDKLAECKLEEKEENKIASEDSEDFINTIVQKRTNTNAYINEIETTPLELNIGRRRRDWETS